MVQEIKKWNNNQNYRYNFISIIIISSTVYFRNNVVSLSHSYFPNFVEKNIHKVFDLFKRVKIPFYADFKMFRKSIMHR